MKRMKRVLVLVVLSLAAAAAGCSQASFVDISDGWRASYGEGSEFAREEVRDAGWPVYDLPSHLKGFDAGKRIWLRRQVEIPARLKDRDLAIYLGKIDAADETYFNGNLIGKTGRHMPDYFSTWNQDRYYIIPPGLMKEGKPNLVAFCAYSYTANNLKNGPMIGELKEVENYVFWKRFLAQYFPLSSGVLTVMLALLLIFQSAFGKAERSALFLAAASVLWTFLTFHFCLPDFGISYSQADNLYYALLSLEIIFIYLFIESILDQGNRALRTIIIVNSVAGVAIALSATEASPVIVGWRSMGVGILGIVAQVIWSVPIVRAMKRKNREALPILIAYAIFVICLLHDILLVVNVMNSDLYLINFGYVSIIVSFGIVLAQRMGNIARDLENSVRTASAQNEHLSVVLDKVRTSTEELKAFSATIKDTADRLQGEMASQGGSLEETSSAIEEVTASIESISTNALSQDDAIKKNNEVALQYHGALLK